MAQLGMAFPSQAPQLPGPEPEPWEEHFTPACEPRTEIGHAYWLRQQRALRDHGGPDEQPGIPIHKFASNDGWQVTAQECRQAVAAHEAAMAAGLPHPPALREDVLPFLRAAAQADGFEVY